MNHSFNTNIAKICGIEEAVILENIYFWCKKNEANNKLTDGKPWTYNSVKAFNELFDYMSPSKISRALKSLETEGFIIIGEFNTNAYDHTKWYCITDKTRKIFGEENEKSNFQNENSNNHSDNSISTKSKISITDINTNNKPNINSPESYDSDFPEDPNEIKPKKTTRSKKTTLSAEEKHKMYLSSLPSEIYSLSEKCADKLVNYLIKLQNSRTPATNKLAWQEDFARFLSAENKPEKEILAIIDHAMTGWWSDKIASAKGLLKEYGRFYQQLYSNASSKSNQNKYTNRNVQGISMNTSPDAYDEKLW